jgi:hypothetical protein
VGGSLGVALLVTVYGTASRNEAEKQVPRFLEQASPAERLEFRRTGELPGVWGAEVLTSGVSAAFITGAVSAGLAAVVGVVAILVRPSDLERLQGGAAGAPPG